MAATETNMGTAPLGRVSSMHALNETTLGYPPNENLVIEDWLRDFMWTSACVNLALAGFTFAFQITHPKSRYLSIYHSH
jgi:hypothetical protein